MTQQIDLPTWAAGVTGIAIEGGLLGLGKQVLRVNVSENGLEFSDSVEVPVIIAGTSLTVNGSGPFDSLLVDGSSLTSAVPSTFADTVIVQNLANTIVVGADVSGTLIASSTTGTGDVVLSDSPAITGNMTAETLEIGTSLTVNGAGPFDSLVVDGSSLTSAVDSTFSASVILPNLAGADTQAVMIGADGVLTSTSTQTITETSADPAITELQNVLIALKLALDGR